MFNGIDGFAVAFILYFARGADPGVFVGDSIGVFSRYVDVSVGEGLGAFLCPSGVREKVSMRVTTQETITGYRGRGTGYRTIL